MPFHFTNHTFAFWVGMALLAVMLVFALIKSRSFVFFTSLQEA